MISTGFAILGMLAVPLCWLLSPRVPERHLRILLVLVGATALTTLLIRASVWAEELEVAWALRRFRNGGVYEWNLEGMTPSEVRAYERWHGEDLMNRFAMAYAPLTAMIWSLLWNGILLAGAFVLRRWTPFHRSAAGR